MIKAITWAYGGGRSHEKPRSVRPNHRVASETRSPAFPRVLGSSHVSRHSAQPHCCLYWGEARQGKGTIFMVSRESGLFGLPEEAPESAGSPFGPASPIPSPRARLSRQTLGSFLHPLRGAGRKT
jgi:hypothetical protein